MEITFQALIKKIEIKALVSLDKAARLTLDLSGEDPEIIDKLNRLMRADEFANVRISNSHHHFLTNSNGETIDERNLKT